MEIVAAQVHRFVSAVAPVGSIAAPLMQRAGLLLTLRDEQGRLGQGEASPLPGYSRDSLEQCQAALAALDLARLGGLEVSAPLLPQLAVRLAEQRLNAPAARFAVETALLDLAAQRLAVPLAALLPRTPARRQTVPLSTVIQGSTPAAVAEAARRAVDRGVRSVKRKIGRRGQFARELDELHALSAVLGDAAVLRLDANQAFMRDEVADRLQALAACTPELLEEPLVGGLAGLEPALAEIVPLAADETLQGDSSAASLDALADLMARLPLRALVLKPMALGGFGPCLALAAAAAARDIALVVTHLWDGPVALAAACALALGLPGRVLACGLDRHPGLQSWPAVALPMLLPAQVTQTDRSGLGLDPVVRR